MLLRFITSFLLLTLFFPVGVFGAKVHSCEMKSNAPLASCCQRVENERSGVEGVAKWTHHCSKELLADALQPAAVGQKIQIDALQLMDAGIGITPSKHTFAEIHEVYFTRVLSYGAGGTPSVFLRICSFLI
ncbi:hypothetical protein Pcar_1717 [Syntrophotalea carbinolica DSM 2380]|uniref:Uncharacterized protein n=1 Tax=Syntrophotalea carbinolica (strain DSM 2380 / NBRC 103641 / GraBd1) TaxID=338963 RepID=Q3A3U7_SYNC1|nr:hypothetical protein [Syntrophotalea carbinolica]ABA88960.1 hypothetical protein Pcar_1717 [Syntrophotalea carbinolica DSM 2380]